MITALAAVAAGRAAARYGAVRVVVAGTCMYGIGCAYYAIALPSTPAFAERYLPATVLTGIGIACALPPLTSIATANVSVARLASASAANTAARQLGGVLGIAVLVAILTTDQPHASIDAFQTGWMIVAGSSAAAGAVVAFAGSTPPDAAGDRLPRVTPEVSSPGQPLASQQPT